jgi:amino acid transporter
MTPAPTSAAPSAAPGLARGLGLVGLAATGICSMVGASIHVVPIMIQRNVPGIGPYVLPAFLFAAVPALLAAFAYAVLASAMPRAGGSYVFASRALHPYLGFAASFSQWFGLSIAIGVICYLIVPFVRDVAGAAGAAGLAARLDEGPVRLALALIILGVFVSLNLRGAAVYEWTLVPLMVLMFVLGGVVIVAGFAFDHEQFAAAALLRDGLRVPPEAGPPFRWSTFFAGSSVLFASFIGFDAIAQAGGEARDPRRNLPLAILIAMVTVTTFYMAFAGAVYHAVPWSYVARESATRDLTAPGLLGYLLSPGWTVAILIGATLSLLNDLPGMILSVSRLCFAWAEDGIFPPALARVHALWRTPHNAILMSGLLAAGGVAGSHFAGDFFLGVDLLVISMLVNFLLMCLSVLALKHRNPGLQAQVAVTWPRPLQAALATLGVLFLAGLLLAHVAKDLGAPGRPFYLRSTPVWVLVMTVATVLYVRATARLRTQGVDLRARFESLPPQ